MKVISFVPYGLISKEAGLIAMVSNYLRNHEQSVAQLRCNGVVPVCDRDASDGWQRSITSCLKCISDQARLASWSSQEIIELSPFLTPADVDETKRWMLGLSKMELLSAEYDGVSLARLCGPSFQARFKSDKPDIMNRATEIIVRRTLLASVRILKAVRRFVSNVRPEYALIASGEDYLSASVSQALRERKVKVSIFAWNKHSNDIAIENPFSGKVATYPLVFDDITQLRQDIRTWPTELARMLEEIMAFIDLAPSQLVLPLAR